LTKGGLFLGIYLGISPVYWFSSIPPNAIAAGKLTVIVFAVLAIWGGSSGKQGVTFAKGVYGPLFVLLLIITMIPGFVQSSINPILYSIQSVLMGFVTLWTVFLYIRRGGNIIPVLYVAALLLLPFAILAISANIFGVPNWQSTISELQTLAEAGLGGQRVGWSVGLAMIFPTLLFVAESSARSNLARWVLYVIPSCGIILGSQLAVGGRTGLTASLFTLFVFICRRRPSKGIFVILASILLFSFLNKEWTGNRLRMDRMEGARSIQDLDYFSAGRISYNLLAIDMISERPFSGYGFTSDIDWYSGQAVHNLWLKLAVQSGVMLPLAFALFVFCVTRDAWRLLRNTNWQHTSVDNQLAFALLLTIITGIIITMAEPSVVLGVFQPSAMWWATAGVVKGLIENQRQASGGSPNFNPSIC
jgi:hypothetical protein